MSQKIYAALLCYIHSAVYLNLFLSARDLKFGLPFAISSYNGYFKPCSQAETRHLRDILMHKAYAVIIVCILELHFMHSTGSKMCLFVRKTLTLVSNSP